TPTGGEAPVLALYVVDDRRAGPAQQRGNDQADALARAGRREGHDMLRTVMAQIAAAKLSEEHTGIAKQPGPLDLGEPRPTGGTVGGDMARLPRAPERSCDRGAASQKAAGAGDP